MSDTKPVHSPLPWTIVRSTRAASEVVDKDGWGVTGFISTPFEGSPPLQLRDDANADLCVRAVNSHKNLLDACKAALGTIVGTYEGAPESLVLQLRAVIKQAEDQRTF